MRAPALWRRAILALTFLACGTIVIPHAEAHGRTQVHAARVHYHHRHRHHRHTGRYHRVTFERFERGVADAPINVRAGFTISVFGRDIWFGSHTDDASSSVIGLGVATPFGGASVAVPPDRGHAIALIKANADAYGVPVSLALAIGHFESGFNMHMRGKAGERGAMQVLPQTARHVGVYGDLYGPAGIEAGTRYLKEALTQQRRYGLCAAISAYNHGIGYVRCTGYGRTILALMRGAPTLHAALWQAHWAVPSTSHHRGWANL